KFSNADKTMNRFRTPAFRPRKASIQSFEPGRSGRNQQIHLKKARNFESNLKRVKNFKTQPKPKGMRNPAHAF
ncbi:hypothetical protein, partial [Planococcus sp. CAU13]|uniref:hypothetical protein n=1 Tax=Planococcus sp. CAU13 TaxID=1541197 RepID=UPI00052FE865